MSDETKNDNLSGFGKDFQTKAISAILSDRAFLERIYDILSPDFFEQDAHQWIIKKSTEYFIQYKDLISLTVFGAETNKLSDDVLKAAIQEQLKKSYKEITSGDLTYVKNEFLEFCKHQKIKSAISESIDLLKSKQFDTIKAKFDDALKAGLERNVGHEYNTGLEQRMSASCRETVKTGWDIIDKLLDGGMGKGELIFVVAPAGSGKCVSGNTKIEIQYHETGIPIKGNSGKEHILWFSPFEKIKFNDKVLFGWQIDNLLYEIEKLKLDSQEVVSL